MVLQPDSAKPIQSSTIDSDLPCRQCGYNLRGLMGSGACPECGHAVAESARRNLLRDSDPSYATNLEAAVVLMIIGLGLSGFSAALLPPTLLVDYLDVQSWTALAVVLIVVAILVMSAGLWKLTSIDPAVFDDRRREHKRRLVRVTMVMGTLTQLIGLVILFSSGDESMFPPPMLDRFLLWMFLLANAVALITCAFATFGYLRMMSWRIPDKALARRFELLRWGFGIPFSVLTLATAGEITISFSGSAALLDDHVVVANTVVWAITVLAGLFYFAALVRLWRGAVASFRTPSV